MSLKLVVPAVEMVKLVAFNTVEQPVPITIDIRRIWLLTEPWVTTADDGEAVALEVYV